MQTFLDSTFRETRQSMSFLTATNTLQPKFTNRVASPIAPKKALRRSNHLRIPYYALPENDRRKLPAKHTNLLYGQKGLGIPLKKRLLSKHSPYGRCRFESAPSRQIFVARLSGRSCFIDPFDLQQIASALASASVDSSRWNNALETVVTSTNS